MLPMKEYAPGDKVRASLWANMLPEVVTIIRRCEHRCETDGLPVYQCKTYAGMNINLCSSVIFAIKA